MRLHVLTCGMLLVFMLSACGRKQGQQSTPQTADTSAGSIDTAGKTIYPALLADSAKPAVVDTANPAMKKMIGRFPAAGFVKNSFEYQSKSFMGVEGLDEVYTADYQIGGTRVRLFLTDDRSGLKYVHLTEFATRQSQVKGAPMSFDEGYSVVFHHTEHGWVLGGLKAGYLLGAVGYEDTCLDLVSRWVKALK